MLIFCIDKSFLWKYIPSFNAPIGKALKLQCKDVQVEFHHRVTQVRLYFLLKLSIHCGLLCLTSFVIISSQIITQFKEQGLNTELYNKNKDMGETYSIVPTSAIRYFSFANNFISTRKLGKRKLWSWLIQISWNKPNSQNKLKKVGLL